MDFEKIENQRANNNWNFFMDIEGVYQKEQKLLQGLEEELKGLKKGDFNLPKIEGKNDKKIENFEKTLEEKISKKTSKILEEKTL